MNVCKVDHCHTPATRTLNVSNTPRTTRKYTQTCEYSVDRAALKCWMRLEQKGSVHFGGRQCGITLCNQVYPYLGGVKGKWPREQQWKDCLFSETVSVTSRTMPVTLRQCNMEQKRKYQRRQASGSKWEDQCRFCFLCLYRQTCFPEQCDCDCECMVIFLVLHSGWQDGCSSCGWIIK